MFCQLYSLQIYYSRLWHVFSLFYSNFWIMKYTILMWSNISISLARSLFPPFLLVCLIPEILLYLDIINIFSQFYSRGFKMCLSTFRVSVYLNWFLYCYITINSFFPIRITTQYCMLSSLFLSLLIRMSDIKYPYIWICLWDLYSVLLIYLSVLAPLSHLLKLLWFYESCHLFFKTALTLLWFLHIHRSLKSACDIPWETLLENLIGIALKYPINMGKMGILTKLTFYTWTWFIFWFIQVFNFFQ